MKSQSKNYSELSAELDKIISELQDPSTDIDQAMKLYQRGQELVTILEGYLNKTKNIIKKIKTTP